MKFVDVSLWWAGSRNGRLRHHRILGPSLPCILSGSQKLARTRHSALASRRSRWVQRTVALSNYLYCTICLQWLGDPTRFQSDSLPFGFAPLCGAEWSILGDAKAFGRLMYKTSGRIAGPAPGFAT